MLEAAPAPPADVAPLPRLTLVLGGARSGKSRHAERLVESAARRGLYLATAEAKDAEMRERVARHRARRGAFWETVEEPLALPERLPALALPGRPVLVDCLTLWLSNLMLAGADTGAAGEGLVAALRRTQAPVVLVANEVGLGIVPENPLARAFRDAAGWLNQELAAAADRVLFVAASLPIVLKQQSKPSPVERERGSR